MGVWAEAWGVWKDGISVSSGEELGRVLGSVVRGILGGREIGSVLVSGGVRGEFRLMLGMEGGEVVAGGLGVVWGGFCRSFGGGARSDVGKGRWVFVGGRRMEILVLLTLSLWFSQLAKVW